MFALAITSYGLSLDNEAIRIAVGPRLRLNLCVPHQCHRGSLVDAHGRLHKYKKAQGRMARHALSELVAQGFASAGLHTHH